MVSVLALALVGACGGDSVSLEQEGAAPFSLSSSAFEAGGRIPSHYTCDGADISPELSWGEAPEGTAGFALVMDDPDANNFTHWVLFNLPGGLRGIPEGVPPEDRLTNGSVHGKGFGENRYGGPCPPDGTHLYRIFLFALDREGVDGTQDLEPGTEKGRLLEVIEGHVLGQGLLEGRYEREG